ncbi:intracellular septation protein [Legionella beliardensis]|uniref:Inner membrane-spanning protein YciB n=1 Tax=Legionella beliardensis TaxID=91822 RepID=A0A378I812_9GAMM|nr:inner membrane-spanning protein YciB [Legionella beliardensis]STX28534.1 intracellular septation protein [Legionella beliardensis]
MKFLYEIFPIVLFFLAFKFYDIYLATYVGIIATAIQVIMTRLIQKKWDKVQLFTLLTFVVFGGLTLYLRDPIFIKWKPSIIFWTFALLILVSHFILKKSLLQFLISSMLKDGDNLPASIWNKLNNIWIIFFVLIGFLNLIFAYYFSTNAWVNFKFYGISLGVILISIIQTIYIRKWRKKLSQADAN